jgi:hypothetical protein
MMKTVVNLLFHRDYFGMDTKWHFSAVSHGKGACARTGEKTGMSESKSVKSFEEEIMKPRQLYECTTVKIPSVTFQYFTVEDHKKGTMMLEERFRKAWTPLGTQKNTASYSCLKNQDHIKVFSEPNMFNTTHIAHLQDEQHQAEDIRKFITCEYDRNLWLVCVTSE